MIPGRVLRFRAAPYRRRLLADAVDAALVALGVALLWRLGAVSEPLPAGGGDLLDRAADLAAADAILLLPAAVAACFLGLLYGALSRATLGGTPGERLLGLRLLDPSGALCGPARATLHGLGTILTLGTLGLGHTAALVSKERRTLAEWLSGARLVQGRPRPDVSPQAVRENGPT